MKKTIKPIKKMKTGGSAGCPPGQCPKYVGGKKEGCEPCKAGIIAGLTTTISGVGTMIGKMIGDKIKNTNQKKQALADAKKAEAAAQNTPKAKFKKGMDNKLKTQKRGGSVKSKKK